MPRYSAIRTSAHLQIVWFVFDCARRGVAMRCRRTAEPPCHRATVLPCRCRAVEPSVPPNTPYAPNMPLTRLRSAILFACVRAQILQ